MKNLYKIEITDTFGGEANYCWIRRYLVRASSERGAVSVLAREYGAGWIKDYEGRYDLRGAAICAFVDWVSEEDAREYFNLNLRVECLPTKANRPNQLVFKAE